MSLKAIYDKARQDDALAHRLVLANKILTMVGYIAYPLLLILVLLFDVNHLLKCIVVPACGFIITTAIRYFYNAPRPYENGGPLPLAPKSTKGKSFPSRHTFCMFMIALTWAVFTPAFFPPLGIIVSAILIACACAMACLRVICGVHYLRDVIAGAALAIIVSLIGFWVL